MDCWLLLVASLFQTEWKLPTECKPQLATIFDVNDIFYVAVRSFLAEVWQIVVTSVTTTFTVVLECFMQTPEINLMLVKNATSIIIFDNLVQAAHWKLVTRNEYLMFTNRSLTFWSKLYQFFSLVSKDYDHKSVKILYHFKENVIKFLKKRHNCFSP